MASRRGGAPRGSSVRGRAPPPSTCACRARTASTRATDNAALGSDEQHTTAGRHSPAARVATRSHSSARRAHATRGGSAAAPVGPRCSAANARHAVMHHTYTTMMRKSFKHLAIHFPSMPLVQIEPIPARAHEPMLPKPRPMLRCLVVPRQGPCTHFCAPPSRACDVSGCITTRSDSRSTA